MKPLIYFLLITTVIWSCQKSDENEEYILTGVDIYVQNIAGEDLLESQFPFEDIKVFYLIDDEIVEFYKANLDAPRGIKIIDFGDKKALNVGLNSADVAYPITYLEWNELDTDTIVCAFQKTADGLVSRLDSLWYNGIRMIPDQVHGPTLGFKIIK